MHGITMILWYAFPGADRLQRSICSRCVLGTRDMAFPRLNAFTYWVFLLSGHLPLCRALPSAAAPNAGWFNYVPYAARAFNPGPNIDFYALANILLGISTTLGSINFIVTILRMRAPGMSINRLPILSWGTLTISVGNLFADAVGQPGILPALDGPPVRHAFLRCRRRRPAAALAASVLDVGASVGLCHRPAGDEHGLATPAGASAAVRWSAIPPSLWRRS